MRLSTLSLTLASYVSIVSAVDCNYGTITPNVVWKRVDICSKAIIKGIALYNCGGGKSTPLLYIFPSIYQPWFPTS